MNRRAFLGVSLATAAIWGGGKGFSAGLPSNRVRLAIMGCQPRGRGFHLMKTAAKLPGVEIATVCDVDSRASRNAVATIERMTGKRPREEADIRRVLEDPALDGVICAAPDHWHAPAAWMTMQAGKAIYVEKPCAHNPREGEILVKVARQTGMPFQMGNQRRSSLVFRQAVKEISEGVIGKTCYARCWYMSNRRPIGKGRETPVPEWLNWKLWQGPAPERPFRNNLVHYNWHWFKHWGTGEAGNNATHFLDIARWAMRATFPKRVTSAGGRYFHGGDDWEWYDTQNASFEFEGGKMIHWEGLSSANGRFIEGFSSGALVYGTRGSVLFAPDNSCTLYSKEGKRVRRWSGRNVEAVEMSSTVNPTGSLDQFHLGNWVDAIRDPSRRTASPACEAYRSTLLPCLANIAVETGETVRLDPATGRLLTRCAEKLWSREYAKGWEVKL